MGKIKEYTNDDITVVWKPEICIHAAKCVGSQPRVFRPRKKPWIQLDNANSEAIMKAVDGCPSGALSYRKNNEQNTKIENSENVMKVQVMDKGPLLVHGKISITHADGSVEEKDKITAFCRCGRTNNNPYCDGTHKQG